MLFAFCIFALIVDSNSAGGYTQSSRLLQSLKLILQLFTKSWYNSPETKIASPLVLSLTNFFVDKVLTFF